MSTTPNLSLNVYEPEDNPLVKTWRDDLTLNFVSSSLVKIDTWAGQTGTRLDDLEGSRTNFRISATSSVQDNYTATSSEIISLTAGMQLQFSASQNNIGSSTLNINDIGTKTIRKINNLGETVNLELNDIIPNRLYTFEYDGTIWILRSGFTGSQIIINGTVGNIISIDAENNLTDSSIAIVDGKITSAGITMGAGITDDGNGSIMLSDTAVAPGIYVGLTIDNKGRIIEATTPNPSLTGDATLISTDGVLSWNTQAPDSAKFGGELPANYLTIAHANATSAPNMIPIADDAGKLAVGWMAQPQFYPLTTPLTSTSWDGDAKTSADNGIIDLSASFGAPANIKAISVRVEVTSTTAGKAVFIKTATGVGNALVVTTQVADLPLNAYTIVPCDANGDVYFIAETGATFTSVTLEIYGYWL